MNYKKTLTSPGCGSVNLKEDKKIDVTQRAN